CNPKTIGDWPAKNLLEFLRHLTDGDMLLRMKGGTPAFVDSLIKGIDIHSGSAIKKVELQGEKVLVENEKGDQGTFDRVIVACNPKTIGDWPAKNLLEFLRHLTDGDMLLRMKG
ncbi:FAD-dependent oxidoreductase, partial [Staphylococcus aureus]|uniref:FAD-dependent oxidoreductase n=1 Tax=Staphylococcus aureus TaxID=1280 RepID=UPI001C82F4A1